MRKVKQIFTVFFAAVVLLTTSGFALHTITCQMTGDTYVSVTDKKCCCEGSDHETKKCCNEESLVLGLDSQAALKEFSFNVNPVFFVALLTQYGQLNFPAEYGRNYLNYFKHFPHLFEPEIIILVQSFLL